eukprot:m.443119 g.443119  ORF g.443119 m.443119 type:complete len:486 (-) comp18924_c0_seq1:2037-3494(-)
MPLEGRAMWHAASVRQWWGVCVLVVGVTADPDSTCPAHPSIAQDDLTCLSHTMTDPGKFVGYEQTLCTAASEDDAFCACKAQCLGVSNVRNITGCTAFAFYRSRRTPCTWECDFLAADPSSLTMSRGEAMHLCFPKSLFLAASTSNRSTTKLSSTEVYIIAAAAALATIALVGALVVGRQRKRHRRQSRSRTPGQHVATLSNKNFVPSPIKPGDHVYELPEEDRHDSHVPHEYTNRRQPRPSEVSSASSGIAYAELDGSFCPPRRPRRPTARESDDEGEQSTGQEEVEYSRISRLLTQLAGAVRDSIVADNIDARDLFYAINDLRVDPNSERHHGRDTRRNTIIEEPYSEGAPAESEAADTVENESYYNLGVPMRKRTAWRPPAKLQDDLDEDEEENYSLPTNRRTCGPTSDDVVYSRISQLLTALAGVRASIVEDDLYGLSANDRSPGSAPRDVEAEEPPAHNTARRLGDVGGTPERAQRPVLD